MSMRWFEDTVGLTLTFVPVNKPQSPS